MNDTLDYKTKQLYDLDLKKATPNSKSYCIVYYIVINMPVIKYVLFSFPEVKIAQERLVICWKALVAGEGLDKLA